MRIIITSVLFELAGGGVSGANQPISEFTRVRAFDPEPQIEFEFVTDASGFRALEPDWRRLSKQSAASGQIFQSFDWQWHTWTCVAREVGHQLRILVGRVQQRIVLIWPLVADGNSLKFLSNGHPEYRDVIVEQGARIDAWLDAAWRTLLAVPGNSCIVLNHVRSDSALSNFLARLVPYRADRHAWIIQLGRWRNWDAFAPHLPRDLRADQRRQWRRIRKLLGDVQFRIATDWEQIKQLIDWFFCHKTRWLEQRSIYNEWFATPEHRSFTLATALDMHSRGELLVGFIGSDSDILSVGFGFVVDRAFLFHGYAYNADYNRLSPSRLLLEELVRRCFELGLDTFDFEPGAMPYEAVWSDTTLGISDYIMPISLLGRFKIGWHRNVVDGLLQRDSLRRHYNRLPLGVRRVARRLFGGNLNHDVRMKRNRM